MQKQKQIIELLNAGKNLLSEIKTCYIDFLSSLKYQNLEDKKINRFKKRTEQIQPLEGWESLIQKRFNFQEEIMNQNTGMASFMKLLDHIKKLDQINSQLSIRFLLQQKQNPGIDQLINAKYMMQFVQNGLVEYFTNQNKEARKEAR